MFTMPTNSDEMFEEIGTFAKDLPNPHNQLFLIEIYKLYAQHKIEYLSATIITEYETQLEKSMEAFNGPSNKLRNKG